MELCKWALQDSNLRPSDYFAATDHSFTAIIIKVWPKNGTFSFNLPILP
jgi:hypothetical protein